MRNTLFSMLLAAPLMFGGPVNTCPNTTASTTVSNGSTTMLTTTPGVGPGNDLAGCTAVDLMFSQFGNSTFTGTGMNGAETLAGTYLAETPAGTGNNPLTNPDTLLFGTVRGATNVNTDGDNNDGLNNWISNRNNPLTDDITYSVSNSGNNPAAVIYSVLLTVTNGFLGTNGTGVASGSFTIDICEGTAANSQITSAGACTTAGGTAFDQMTLSFTNLTPQTLNVPLTGPQSALDITTEIDLSTTGTNRAGFDAFSERFNESPTVPEPSTFVLLGSALAGIAFLRRRRTAKSQATRRVVKTPAF
jgi:PEP-CTERM motif-containing protein